MNQIQILFELATAQQATIINQSLQPELRKDIPNTEIQLHCNKNTLTLTITAKNTSALRAASNSYIRWIQTALNITNAI